jgi:glycosyltransferase involved in cell wall biosynthesis
MSVDVVLTTKDRRDMFFDALASVFDQSYRKYNVIVVDDGSKEDYSDTNDDRITFVKHSKSLGAGATKNTGIVRGSSEFIAFLDDDDTWYPEHLETLVEFMEDTESVASFSRMVGRRVDGRIQRIESFNGQIGTLPTPPYFDPLYIWQSNVYLTSGLMYRRELIESVGYWNEDLPIFVGWAFLRRVALKHKVTLCDSTTGEYSIHIRQLTHVKEHDRDYYFKCIRAGMYDTIVSLPERLKK